MSIAPDLQQSISDCTERFDARDYFELWFADAPADSGRVVIVEKRSGASDSSYYDIIADFSPEDVEAVANYVANHANQANLFIKTSLYDMGLIAARREVEPGAIAGGRDEVKTVCGFALDCDAGKDSRYASQDDMWEALHRMPSLPTIIVLSGRSNHGFHAYWRFVNPVPVESIETVVSLNHIARAWRGLLCDKVAEVMRERGAQISPFDHDNLVDRAFGVDRVLRPVGATRSFGDTVRIASLDPNRHYTLEQLTPDGYMPPSPPREYVPRNEDSIIETYFRQRAANGTPITVESLLESEGYVCLDTEGNWRHFNSTSGGRTVQVSMSNAGIPGVNVFSSNCPPLRCDDERNHVGRFYSVYALWVAFTFGDGDDVWRNAATFCHRECPERAEDVFDVATPATGSPAAVRARPRHVLSPDNIGDDSRVVSNCIALLGRDSPWVHESRNRMVFQRANQLVRLQRYNGTIRIEPISRGSIAAIISDAVRLEKEKSTKNGVAYEPVEPPKLLIDAIRDEPPASSIPAIEKVYDQPILRRDGSVAQCSGYDASSASWLEITEDLDSFPSIPDHPTRDDARQAAADILELVREFPFVDAADRSAWLACVLTGCARTAIEGCTPLFAFTAYNRGSGKGLLTDIMHIIVTGQTKKTLSQVKNDEELRKQVTSLLLSGEPVVCWDDAKTKISGAILDPLLTSRSWQDRMLGANKLATIPNLTLWTITGNNLQFDGDTSRRVVLVRLRPQNRNSFSIEDLHRYVEVHRAELYMKALTIVSAYIRAGMPMQPGSSFRSFDGWWRTIRNAITWIGLRDPMLVLDSISEYSDTDRRLDLILGGVSEIQALNNGEPLPIREMLQFAESRPANEVPRFLDLLDELDDRKITKVKALGYEFRKYAGTEREGRRLISTATRDNRKAWGVEVFAFDSLANS